MAKLLLDTSLVIDHLRTRDKNQTAFLELFDEKHEMFVSILTHTECYAGKSVWKKEEEWNYLKDVLSGLKIISLEEKISLKAGELRANHNIGLGDAIIAATAIIHKLPLATLNIKHFEKVPGLKLR